MPMLPGDAVVGTGLAGKIADELSTIDGFDRKKAKVQINAIAKAIVEYIQDNADIEVTGVSTGVDTASGTIS